jgi:hypothetical protein
MIRTIGHAAGAPEFAHGAAAMDATGLETTTASAHFQSRRGRTRRKWVKASTIVLCGSLPPLSLVLGGGPGNDKRQAQALITKANETTLPAKYRRPLRCGMQPHSLELFHLGKSVSNSPAVTSTMESGPGEFPTGRKITFHETSDYPIRDGKAVP